MKKSIYIASALPLFYGAVLSAENLDVNEYTTISSASTYDYIDFTASETLDYSARITINKGINVGDGVYAILQNQSSSSSVRLATGVEDITIAGAGMYNSTLSFSGRYIDGGIDNGDNPLFTTSINLKDINFTMQRRVTTANGLELKSLNAENSILQVIAKASTSTGSETAIKVAEGMTFKNSQLIIDNGAQLTLYTPTSATSNVISLTDSTFDISGNIVYDSRSIAPTYNITGVNNFIGSASYNLNNVTINDGASITFSGGGTKTIANIDNTNGLSNATLTIESDTTLSVGSTATNLKMQNSTIQTDGTVSANSTQFDFAGKNTISGEGSIILKANIQSSQLYITAKNFRTDKELHVNSKSAIASIGKAEDGTLSAVNYVGNLQADSGKLVFTGGSVFNAEGSTRTFVVNNGASAEIDNATIYAVSSRICTGTFNGTIETNGRNTGGTRDYSLSFGAWNFGGAQRSSEIAKNVILGANASTNVNASSATFFGIYGTVTSNVATKGALKSNANAPLMIYKDTTLTLKTTDAFAVGGATSQASSDFNFYEGATNVTLDIDATNNIGRLVYGNASTAVKLDIANGVTLTIGGIVLADGETGVVNVILKDMLQNGSLVVTDMDSILSSYATSGSSSAIAFLDESGNARILNDNLFLKQIGDTTSYSIYTQVPEPASWAAILGAIALGFVAYRRRK